MWNCCWFHCFRKHFKLYTIKVSEKASRALSLTQLQNFQKYVGIKGIMSGNMLQQVFSIETSSKETSLFWKKFWIILHFTGRKKHAKQKITDWWKPNNNDSGLPPTKLTWISLCQNCLLAPQMHFLYYPYTIISSKNCYYLELYFRHVVRVQNGRNCITLNMSEKDFTL